MNVYSLGTCVGLTSRCYTFGGTFLGPEKAFLTTRRLENLTISRVDNIARNAFPSFLAILYLLWHCHFSVAIEFEKFLNPIFSLRACVCDFFLLLLLFFFPFVFSLVACIDFLCFVEVIDNWEFSFITDVKNLH